MKRGSRRGATGRGKPGRLGPVSNQAMATQIDRNRCKGCGLCIEFCPKHILGLEPGLNPAGYHPAVNHEIDACTACGLCAEMCPEAGIRVTRRKKKKARA